MLRFLTAGESHGPGLVVTLDGLPAGLRIQREDIARELGRRQLGYGRGGRQRIERDPESFELLAGVRHGYTLGSPVAMTIPNRDYENWQERMSPELPPTLSVSAREKSTTPRPGHADLAGILKYGHNDIRNVLERASARETAARVAAGALAKVLLREFDVHIYSHVVQVGNVKLPVAQEPLGPKSFEHVDDSPMRCIDPRTTEEMIAEVKRCRKDKDSVGGMVEVRAFGVLPGLGSYSSWDRRMDGFLAQAVMSIPAIKAVGIGEGWHVASMRGSHAHDEIFWDRVAGYHRGTNHAGGLEGGVTNGEPVVISAAMKPMSTLPKPLQSVDISTHQPAPAHFERTDVTPIAAAAVIAESVIALALGSAYREKFGGDNIADMRHAVEHYRGRLNSLLENGNGNGLNANLGQVTDEMAESHTSLAFVPHFLP